MKWKEIPKEDVPKHDTIQIATFHYAQEDVPVFLIPDESLSTETGQQGVDWKEEYDAAVNEIGQLQDQLKEAESEIRSLQNELRNSH